MKDENFLKKLGEADAAGIAATYGFSKGNNGNEQATVQIKNKNDFNGTAQIEVSGSGNGYKVAVWSEENGQDDLVWYSLPGTARVINLIFRIIRSLPENIMFMYIIGIRHRIYARPNSESRVILLLR